MNYRMPLERISHLAIDGEVQLNEIRLSASASSMPFAGVAPPYVAAPPYPGMPMPGTMPTPHSAPYPTQAGHIPYSQPTYGANQTYPVSIKSVIFFVQ